MTTNNQEPLGGEKCKYPRCGCDSRASCSVGQQAGAAGASIDYTPGSWFKARTLDEMQAFYFSRLPAIREAAKEHGYAIGLHGSTRRDFDLMAMQWREDASDRDTLAHAIAVAACGLTRDGAFQWTRKPSGRFAVSLPICWTDHANPDFDKPSVGHIDLSVIAATPTAQAQGEPVAWITFRTKDGRETLKEGCVATNRAYTEAHSQWVWEPLGRLVNPSAQADEVRDAALEALLTRIDDAWENYERHGEICPFEGQPMIYASTLEEIVELRRALRTTAAYNQKG